MSFGRGSRRDVRARRAERAMVSRKWRGLQGPKWRLVTGCSPRHQRSLAHQRPEPTAAIHEARRPATPPPRTTRTVHWGGGVPADCACAQLRAGSTDQLHGHATMPTSRMRAPAMQSRFSHVTKKITHVHANARRTPPPNAASIELPAPLAPAHSPTHTPAQSRN